MSISQKSQVLLVGGVLVLGASGGAAAAGMVTGAQIKDGSVTGKDVKNQSLTTADIAGPAAQSFTRIQGYQRLSASVPVAAGAAGGVSIDCPAGRHLLGGSTWWADSNAGAQFVPLTDSTGANGFADPVATDDTLTITIVCAPVSGQTVVTVVPRSRLRVGDKGSR